MIPKSMHATSDRGEIVHLAGRLRLSPALRDSAPALVGIAETAGRCGWAEFFAALEARRLAVAAGPDGAGPVSLVARDASGLPRPSPGARARAAVAEARRFFAALRGRPPEP